MRLRFSIRLRLAILFLVIPLAVACDGYTSLRGRVLDAAGGPVPNATVRLSYGEKSSSVLSDSTGSYLVTLWYGGFIAPGLTLTAEAPGYRPIRHRSPQGFKTVDLVLVRDSAAP